MPWGVGARDVALTQGNALQGDLLQGSLCQWCRCLLYVDTAALGCAFLFCWAFYGPSYSGYIYICIMSDGKDTLPGEFYWAPAGREESSQCSVRREDGWMDGGMGRRLDR